MATKKDEELSATIEEIRSLIRELRDDTLAVERRVQALLDENSRLVAAKQAAEARVVEVEARLLAIEGKER